MGTGSFGDYKYNPTGTAWTFSNSSGVAGNGSGFTASNPSAPEGTQVAFLQGTGTISQSVNFSAGTYDLTFYAAQRGSYQASSQTFQVLIDGASVGNFTPSNKSYSNLTTSTFTVTAGSHTIEFVGLNPNGGDNTALLDNVSIQATSTSPPPSPPPSTVTQPSDAGFESPVVGTGSFGDYKYNPTGTAWTFSNSSGVAGNGSGFTASNPSAPEGTQVAFLQGTGTISQSVNFSAGTYDLTFYAAQRGSYQASSQTFQVQVDGLSVGNFTPSNSSYSSLTTSTFTVTAGSHTIKFVGLNPNGGDNTALLDDVSIQSA